MNRSAKLHSVLRDGNWHRRRDVFERVGFMLTNNAASELRAQGHDVQQRFHRGHYEYRLLNEPETAITGHTSGEADDDHHGSPSGSLSRLTDSDPRISRPTGPPSPAGVGVPSPSESVSSQLTLEEVAA